MIARARLCKETVNCCGKNLAMKNSQQSGIHCLEFTFQWCVDGIQSHRGHRWFVSNFNSETTSIAVVCASSHFWNPRTHTHMPLYKWMVWRLLFITPFPRSKFTTHTHTELFIRSCGLKSCYIGSRLSLYTNSHSFPRFTSAFRAKGSKRS